MNEKYNLDYERDVEVDPDQLDVEFLMQAMLAERYGKHVVQLKDRVRRLEERKKTVRSELILKANEDPETCIGKKSPNSADLEAYYRAHPKYRKVVKKLLKAQTELDYAEVAKWEIAVTRKQTIEGLIELHGQNYFAGPEVPRNLTREFIQKKKSLAADSVVEKQLNKKKKKKRKKSNG